MLALSPRQGEIVAFLTEWAGERGLDITTLPRTKGVNTAVARAFGLKTQTVHHHMTALAAVGVFEPRVESKRAVLLKELCDLMAGGLIHVIALNSNDWQRRIREVL